MPDTRPKIEKGTDLFEKLPDSQKLNILGPAKFAAYQDGKLALADAAGFRKDPKWGPVGGERSLKEILQEKYGEADGAKLAAQYLNPVRRGAAARAAATRAAATGGGSGKGGKPTVTGGGGMSQHPVDRLIREIGETGREPTSTEIDRVVRHVAGSDFPSVEDVAGKRLAGLEWQGRILNESDRLPYDVIHYLRHVRATQEWPEATELGGYIQSIRDVAVDPSTGLAVSYWQGREWHVSFLRRSGDLLGPDGSEWVVVEYLADKGHWLTAYQLKDGIGSLTQSKYRRQGFRWLRLPQ